MELHLHNLIAQFVSYLDVDSIILTPSEMDYIQSFFPTKYSIEYNLLFRASRDGFAVDTFHELCDNKGPTLCIFHSEHNSNLSEPHFPSTLSNDSKKFPRPQAAGIFLNLR